MIMKKIKLFNMAAAGTGQPTFDTIDEATAYVGKNNVVRIDGDVVYYYIAPTF